MTEMTMDDDGFSQTRRRTLPYLDLDDVNRDQAGPRDSRAHALESEAASRIEADVAEIKETLGRPPEPGRPGSGLVGAVVEMQRTIERLVSAEEARAKASTPPPRRGVSKPLAIALVAALGGGGGIAGIIHAATGNAAPPAAQQQQQPPRGP